jgi:MYXO-CTERM domain-containing protein
MVASSGKLYGVTSAGGVNSSGTATTLGTIFSMDRAGTNFSRLYSFDGKDGSLPSSKLLETAPGVFVGAAASAGNCSYGTVFRYSLAGDTVTGNTRCGQKKNNNSGGGSAGLVVLLLFAGLGLVRRRTA